MAFPLPFDLPDFGQNTTTIINEARVETNTGGNSSQGGTVEKGDAKASVQVKTEVNGEEVENISIEIDTEGQETVEKETEIENGVMRTKVDVEVNSETPVEQEGSTGQAEVKSQNETNSSLTAKINQVWQKVVNQLIDKIKYAFKLFL